MNSIRTSLVVVILAVVTLFYFIAALRGYQSSMHEAERLFDKQLLDTARLIANIHTGRSASNIGHDSSIAFQVWQQQELLVASRNAPVEALASTAPGFGHANFDGYRWRTAAYEDPETANWVLVAERTDLRFALAENVILESLLPTLVGLPVVGLLVWVIVGGGLRPLRELAHALGSKQAQDLSPLSIPSPRKELERIIVSCNGLLERLESSLQRERQFASDAAHELRTPISALKVQVYNLANEPGVESKTSTALEQTANRLEHIVEQILDLYRSSPDQYNASFTELDLSELAREVLAEEFPAFDHKHQGLEFTGESASIRCDRFAVRTLLRNLLGNACKYTPAGGQVRVSVERLGAHTRLSVEDSGPGIPEQLRQAVFERFYRVGGDQHLSGETGCGLGLAIVRRLADLHGAIVTIGNSRLGGAAFVVDFPASVPAGYRPDGASGA